MSAVVTCYRPTTAAIARAKPSSGPTLPREIHVHAGGHAVAVYDAHADVHFTSLFGLLDHHGLTMDDIEGVDRPSLS